MKKCDTCNKRVLKHCYTNVDGEIFCDRCYMDNFLWSESEVRYNQFIGTVRETNDFVESLMQNPQISSDAFKLAYFVMNKMGCWPIKIKKIAENFSWNIKQTLDAIDVLAEIDLLKINE